MITDGDGRIVEGQSATEKLPPAALPFHRRWCSRPARRSPPGEYVLKLAAAEGNRVGSVEHPIHVSLIDGGALQLSDLTVGGPQAGHGAAAADRSTIPSASAPSMATSKRMVRQRGNRHRHLRGGAGRTIACPGQRGRGGPADQRVARAFQQDPARQRPSAGPVSTPRNRGCWRRTGGNVVARLRDRGAGRLPGGTPLTPPHGRRLAERNRALPANRPG